MAITINKLHSRYLQASDALDDYAVHVSEKISGGNTDNNLIHKFNLMSAWIGYMNEVVVLPRAIAGKTPDPITIPAITRSTECVVLGVEDINGTFVYLGRVVNYKVMASGVLPEDLGINKLHQSINSRTGTTGVYSTFNASSTNLIIHFENTTSKYNGQKLKYSPNATYTGELKRVRGGADSLYSGTVLSEDLMEKLNTVLEDMAIELQISYKN